MYSVILDSSNQDLLVALAKEDALIDVVCYPAWQRQSELMVKEMENLFIKHNVDKSDIGDVIVSIGPGSYTGVRIALTIAKTMNLALNIPIYPISSLHAMKDDNLPSICLINARSNRSYIGIYENENVIISDTIFNNDDVKAYILSHPNYHLMGDLKYLNLNGKKPDVAKQLLELKKITKPLHDGLGLKPIYLKN